MALLPGDDLVEAVDDLAGQAGTATQAHLDVAGPQLGQRLRPPRPAPPSASPPRCPRPCPRSSSVVPSLRSGLRCGYHPSCPARRTATAAPGRRRTVGAAPAGVGSAERRRLCCRVRARSSVACGCRLPAARRRGPTGGRRPAQRGRPGRAARRGAAAHLRAGHQRRRPRRAPRSSWRSSRPPTACGSRSPTSPRRPRRWSSPRSGRPAGGRPRRRGGRRPAGAARRRSTQDGGGPAEGGRGLLLVSRFASRWGTSHERGRPDRLVPPRHARRPEPRCRQTARPAADGRRRPCEAIVDDRGRPAAAAAGPGGRAPTRSPTCWPGWPRDSARPPPP